MKHPTRRGGRKGYPLQADEIEFIKTHHATISVPKLAIQMKRHYRRIYDFMEQHNLKPFGHRPGRNKTTKEQTNFNVSARDCWLT